MTVSADIAKVKAVLASVESKAATAISGVIPNERLKDRRLWVALLAIPLLLIMHHFGYDVLLIDRIFTLALVLIVCWTVHGVGRDLANAWIQSSRNYALAQEGKLDPADNRPTPIAVASGAGAAASAGGATASS